MFSCYLHRIFAYPSIWRTAVLRHIALRTFTLLLKLVDRSISFFHPNFVPDMCHPWRLSCVPGIHLWRCGPNNEQACPTMAEISCELRSRGMIRWPSSIFKIDVVQWSKSGGCLCTHYNVFIQKWPSMTWNSIIGLCLLLKFTRPLPIEAPTTDTLSTWEPFRAPNIPLRIPTQEGIKLMQLSSRKFYIMWFRYSRMSRFCLQSKAVALAPKMDIVACWLLVSLNQWYTFSKFISSIFAFWKYIVVPRCDNKQCRNWPLLT